MHKVESKEYVREMNEETYIRAETLCSLVSAVDEACGAVRCRHDEEQERRIQ